MICRVSASLLLCAGEYARFQPRAAGFQQAVGGDVRGVLEAALARHSTLTQGDWISVSVAGQEHELLVQKTRPGTAISVIGKCAHAKLACSQGGLVTQLIHRLYQAKLEALECLA